MKPNQWRTKNFLLDILMILSSLLQHHPLDRFLLVLLSILTPSHINRFRHHGLLNRRRDCPRHDAAVNLCGHRASGQEAMMIDHRKDLNFEKDRRAEMMYSLLENGPRVGMMCRRREKDPRVETILNLERDHGAEMTKNHDLAKDLGAEMMSNLPRASECVRDLVVATMNHRDLARGRGAGMILSLIVNLSVMIFGLTQTPMNKMRMRGRGSVPILKHHRLVLSLRLCPINCANSQNHKSQ